MEQDLTKTRNGYSLKKGDKVRIVGPKQRHNVVYVAKQMEEMMNADKIFTVDRVHIHSGIPVISIANWNWDIKYIWKIIEVEHVYPKKTKPIFFDPKQLMV